MISSFSKIFLTILLIFITVSGYSQTAAITGNWKAEDSTKNLQMVVYLAKDGNYYGKVINDNSQHSKNGKLVLEELRYNKEANNYEGTMQPPEAGITLNATVTVENADRLKIEAKKLIKKKTMYLTRIK
jgi:uncharacterized protein (DUF2147 family)